MSILKIKDSQGNWVGVPTVKGDTGNGISSAVLNNDYTLTLTFTDGTTYTTPSIRGEKGEQGEPATDMDIHICSASEYDSETRIPTIANPNDKTFYLVPTEDGTSPDLFTEWVYVDDAWEMFGSMKIDLSGYLTDVTVDGTSVVNNGVAEIPVANNFDFGLVKIGTGIGMSDGKLNLLLPAATDIKSGLGTTNALFPLTQHHSTFYGLAKVAGHDEKDSTLPVGQYTDEAKSSIQDMLDVPSTSELKEVNDSKADVIVESASGDIVSFDDGADDMPLKSSVVDINPVQDLNGYDSPWVGGGGKNLLDSSLLKDQEAWNIIPIKVKPNTAYTASTDKPSLSAMPAYFTINNTDGGGGSNNLYVNHSVTITSTEDGYVYFSQRRASGEDSFANYHFQVEKGSTATNWTPYENICPINGWTGMQLAQTGKNLFGGLPMAQAIVNAVGNATYSKLVSDDTGDYVTVKASSYTSGKGFTDGVKFKNNTQYTVILRVTRNTVGTPVNSNISVEYTDGTSKSINFVESTDTEIVTVAFVTDGAKTIKCIRTVWGGGTSKIYYDECGVFEGTLTADDFEPYTGQSIPISWQTEAGIVYGGIYNVLTGKLIINKGTVTFNGSEAWSKNADVNTLFTLHLNYPSLVNLADNTDDDIRVISDKLIGVSAHTATTSSSRKGYQIAVISNSRFYVVMPQTEEPYITSAADFKTWLANNPVTVCYELATPIEVQLTPHEITSLLGHNTIYANTGNTSVEYCADTELYIEKVKPSVNVDDVQINNTSIVNNGIANIPLATADTAGVVKVDPYTNAHYGGIASIDNKLFVVGSPFNGIKYGGDYSKPVVAGNQHYSTFYGLAKAAGADEKDSTLAFGTYSDNAKSSIQNMLGITDKYSPKKWVAESETELVTNAHSVGDLFYIGETLYKVIADLNAGDAINVGVNVEEVNVNDILDDYATKEDVQDNVSIVEKSASGSIASFDDGMDDMPLKSLTVDINPVQDLHGYDSPWVAGGGVNKLPPMVDGTYTGNGVTAVVKDGVATLSGTTTASGNALIIPLTSEFTITEGYVHLCNSAVNASLGSTFEDANNVSASSATWAFSPANRIGTIPSNKVGQKWNRIRFYIASGVTISGTFSPMVCADNAARSYSPYENICPISGWEGMEIKHDGKNLFDKDATSTGNGYRTNQYVSADGVIAGGSNFNVSEYIPVKPNTTYTISPLTGSNPSVAFYDSTKAFISGIKYNSQSSLSFTTPQRTMYIRLSIPKANADIFQLELGSTATSYNPYTGRSITINLGQTVYGGKLDVLSGELTVDKAMVDLGTLGYSKSSLIQNGFVATSGMPDNFPLAPSTTAVPNWICSNYGNIVSNVAIESASVDYALAWRVSAQNKGIIVKDSNYTEFYTNNDMASFKEAMSSIQLCYELAEPITIQLTPVQVNSLLGANNIWADTGDTSIEYFSQVDKDLIDYIETSLKPYAKEEKLNDYVSDVQVNGNSIVENNVANVPIATQNVIGALYTASEADGKVGTHTYRAIVPKVQHSSVFYGLAKAAGVDMASSSNAIGIYTDEAKTAIKQMLGIHDTIDSFVEEVSGTDVTITGQPSYRYDCGELYSLTVTPPSSGTIDIRFTSGSTPTVLTLSSTVKMPEWWVGVEANTIYEMCITDGIYCGVMTWAI